MRVRCGAVRVRCAPGPETSCTSARVISREGTGISGHSGCVCGTGACSGLLEHLQDLWLCMLAMPIVTALADALRCRRAGMRRATGAPSL